MKILGFIFFGFIGIVVCWAYFILFAPSESYEDGIKYLWLSGLVGGCFGVYIVSRIVNYKTRH